ncbi:equilibrative nucleoside transporter 1-like [Argiope bruennichi]|uniref:equilibrative nucleoside transporter 1-like n=1 Tax=Argiope bruennichi TaxID=94029 RepID=UPI002494D36A|nr:equilibrative nucleoside transporter 1-like [Argiope bruennichi]
MSNIQFDYSTLSTSISRSDLGSIIGHHILENAYDIQEESNSEKSNDDEEIYVHQSPPDKCKIVYLTFGLLGIGTLLPWNFFITANDYWMYKFRSTLNRSCIDYHNKTDLQATFTSYLALSNNVPYVLFLILCTLYNNRLSKRFRVIGPLITLFLLFGIVTACVEIDTDSWQMGFFSLTILIIIVVGIVSAILQSGVSGIAALLPAEYMHIMVLGQAFAGILASVAQTLSLLGDCDSIKSALIYFFSSDAVIILTLISYAGIQKSKFFKYHTYSLKEATALKDVSGITTRETISILHLLKQIWPYAVTILLDFWVTIGIFPGLAVLIVPESQGNIWNGKLFIPVTCFLLFNISDFCGRIVGGWLPISSSKRMHLLTCCALRLVFLPLIMLCNLQPRYHLPVMLSSDLYYIILMTMLGFTNGYCVAVAMVVGIKSVNPLLQELTGVILSTFLGAGLMIGALTSYICIQMI